MSGRNAGCLKCRYFRQVNNVNSCSHENAIIKYFDALTAEISVVNTLHPFQKNNNCTCTDFEPRVMKPRLQIVKEETADEPPPIPRLPVRPFQGKGFI